jgi:hypothetical protein
MAIQQLSVFVENKPGALISITEILASHGVDMRAMCVAEAQDFGILRLIVDNTEQAAAALKDARCVISVNEVVAVAVSDRPGGMTEVIRLLAEHGINIEYMYAFITVAKQNAQVVLRVEDNEKAEKILAGHGIVLVKQEEIAQL